MSFLQPIVILPKFSSQLGSCVMLSVTSIFLLPLAPPHVQHMVALSHLRWQMLDSFLNAFASLTYHPRKVRVLLIGTTVCFIIGSVCLCVYNEQPVADTHPGLPLKCFTISWLETQTFFILPCPLLDITFLCPEKLKITQLFQAKLEHSHPSTFQVIFWGFLFLCCETEKFLRKTLLPASKTTLLFPLADLLSCL